MQRLNNDMTNESGPALHPLPCINAIRVCPKQ